MKILASALLILIGLLTAAAGGSVVFASQIGTDVTCYAGSNLLKKPEKRTYCSFTDEQIAEMIRGTLSEIERIEGRVASMEADFEQERFRLTEEARIRRETAIINEPEELTILRYKLMRLKADLPPLEKEVKLREFPVGPIKANAPFVFYGGIGLIVLGIAVPLIFRGTGRNPNKRKLAKGAIEFEHAEEFIPAAKYAARAGAGFASKSEAVAWMQDNDHLVTCTYCGKDLPIETLGTVRYVEFYKERPADVKTVQKIKLGEVFYASLPDSRTCADCGHANRRR